MDRRLEARIAAQLFSPHLRERLAARLDLMEEALDECGRLSAAEDVLHGKFLRLRPWHWLQRAALIRERRALIAGMKESLAEYERLKQDNAADLAYWSG
jgi:hypothetical protein